MAVDIFIPLSKESQFDNLQLRLALRSIDKYAKNVGKIWVYTEVNLKDFQNINVVKMGDPIKDNKDANLINKLRACAKNPDVSENFMFWSDDQVLMQELDLEKAPVVYNRRDVEILKQTEKTRWRKRLKHTLEYVRDHGCRAIYNYDSHTPQPYRKSDVEFVFPQVPYTTQPGFCINTIYYGMLNRPGDIPQQEAKFTVEGETNILPARRYLYLGYDNAGFVSGVNCFLLGYFFDKCKYEK